jgi:hypothetical protein
LWWHNNIFKKDRLINSSILSPSKY